MTILLETVIASIESSDKPYAIRFEWEMYNGIARGGGASHDAITRIIATNSCTPQTAEAIYCTSYGLFQIMGMTLYSDLWFPNPISFFHYDAEQQVTQFRALATKWGFNWQAFDFTDDELLTTFAARYNGPGAIPAYVAKMKAAYAALQK